MRATRKTPKSFRLEQFVPYSLSVLTNTIGATLALAYSERFGLSIPEWRIVAILNRFPGISAREAAQFTAMDKVQVSRAITSLLKAGMVKRKFSKEDQRRSVLALTAQGRGVFGKIVPAAIRFEELLHEGLTHGEIAALEATLAKVQSRASQLEPLFAEALNGMAGKGSSKAGSRRVRRVSARSRTTLATSR